MCTHKHTHIHILHTYLSSCPFSTPDQALPPGDSPYKELGGDVEGGGGAITVSRSQTDVESDVCAGDARAELGGGVGGSRGGEGGGGWCEGYDDRAHEWKMTAEDFRKHLARLGFVDA